MKMKPIYAVVFLAALVFFSPITQVPSYGIDVNAQRNFDRGLMFVSLGDYSIEIEYFTNAIRLDPYFISAYLNRGYTYFKRGNYDNAIADFNRALRVYPNDTDVYITLGNAYYYKTDYVRAIENYDKAIKLNPTLGVAYFNCGIAYSKKGDKNNARMDSERVLRLHNVENDTRIRFEYFNSLNNEPLKHKLALRVDY